MRPTCLRRPRLSLRMRYMERHQAAESTQAPLNKPNPFLAPIHPRRQDVSWVLILHRLVAALGTNRDRIRFHSVECPMFNNLHILRSLTPRDCLWNLRCHMSQRLPYLRHPSHSTHAVASISTTKTVIRCTNDVNPRNFTIF